MKPEVAESENSRKKCECAGQWRNYSTACFLGMGSCRNAWYEECRACPQDYCSGDNNYHPCSPNSYLASWGRHLPVLGAPSPRQARALLPTLPQRLLPLQMRQGTCVQGVPAASTSPGAVFNETSFVKISIMWPCTKTIYISISLWIYIFCFSYCCINV